MPRRLWAFASQRANSRSIQPASVPKQIELDAATRLQRNRLPSNRSRVRPKANPKANQAPDAADSTAASFATTG